MPSSSPLRLTGLTRRFGHVIALDGIDLTVTAGQFMVLLGPSGSGKTTLLRLVAGIDRASAGSIAIGTSVVADQGLHVAPERRSLAMVFQQYALWPQVSVLANVVYALERLHLPRQESRRRALAMLDRVGLVRLANRRPPELSGGEQQRVALARALVARPAVLLCDEPLSNLDADLRERLRAEIATLARENDTTVVYITHDQVEAFALADRIGVLQDGRLVQCDLPESVYHVPATPFVARFTGVAGELHGRVAGRPDSAGRFLVDTPNGPLTASGPAPAPLGSAVTVLVRPAAARLVPRVDDDSGLLSRVRDVAYRGHGYDHLVELADGTLLTGVFAEQRRRRGEEVRVRLDPGGSFAYRADAST
ncbi:ABC transporter ATP-binding protein [Actinacidiphila oryziradicis]|uniref:ABC-type quaternary amine transporter n=1 Tax=Actinacidiphila oryziradicis TaxID=2571141 RepID=A0A4U0RXR9_9ACTN|nr:ABC transporter ATP-binding protein [Actinacidiphila oryziradicis]TJZ99620.1 ABC transporter ATP-binding protein [Actinacidiphila oryziradicis]